MTLQSAISRFLSYLLTERNLAPRTVEAYGYDLRRWRSYLEHATEPEEEPIGPWRVDKVSDWDIKDYLAYLQEERNYKPATLSRVISSIRVFFDWLAEGGVISGNPARRLHNPKRGKMLPVYLTQAEARKILAIPDRATDEGVRDYAMLTLLLMTGIRLSEIVGLDISDIEFEGGVIRVLGKGRKERLVPINGGASGAVRSWLEIRPASEAPSLFLSKKGDRVSRRTIQHVVRKTVKAAGLDPRVSPHKLRHTFATSLYAEEVDLRDIQELLGHSDISSTSIYTHTNVEKVRAAVDKLSL